MSNTGSTISITTNYQFLFLDDARYLAGNSSYIVDGVRTEVVLEDMAMNPFQIYLSRAGGQDFALDSCVEVVFGDHIVKNYSDD